MQVLDVRRAHLLDLAIQGMQMQLFRGGFAKNGQTYLITWAITMLENITIVETPGFDVSLKCGVTQLIQRLDGSSALCLFVLLD